MKYLQDVTQAIRELESHCSRTRKHSYNAVTHMGKKMFICKHCKLPKSAVEKLEEQRQMDKKVRHAEAYGSGSKDLLRMRNGK